VGAFIEALEWVEGCSWLASFVLSRAAWDQPTGGLDSLGAVEYVNLVGRRLGMPIPATLVYDFPTVDAITTHLAAKAEAAAAAVAPKGKAGAIAGVAWSPSLSGVGGCYCAEE